MIYLLVGMIKCIRYMRRDINRIKMWKSLFLLRIFSQFAEFLRCDAIFIFYTPPLAEKTCIQEKFFIFHVFHVCPCTERIKYKMYIFIFLRCSQAPSINYNKLFCLRKTQEQLSGTPEVQ